MSEPGKRKILLVQMILSLKNKEADLRAWKTLFDIIGYDDGKDEIENLNRDTIGFALVEYFSNRNLDYDWLTMGPKQVTTISNSRSRSISDSTPKHQHFDDKSSFTSTTPFKTVPSMDQPVATHRNSFTEHNLVATCAQKKTPAPSTSRKHFQNPHNSIISSNKTNRLASLYSLPPVYTKNEFSSSIEIKRNNNGDEPNKNYLMLELITMLGMSCLYIIACVDNKINIYHILKLAVLKLVNRLSLVTTAIMHQKKTLLIMNETDETKMIQAAINTVEVLSITRILREVRPKEINLKGTSNMLVHH